MATALPIATDFTGASVTEAQLKTAITSLRAALAEMGDPLAKFGVIQNLGFSLSVSGNALTIALKTRALADADANNPIDVTFRNVTPATGDFSPLNVNAAHSLVVSSGSTLGTRNGVPFRLWFVLFNDAGTWRLGVINCLTTVANAGSGSDVTAIYPLSGWGIASSTAEGGAGAADSAQTFYTGTAVSAKAFMVLGYATWESGLATAGTWSSGPTRVQPFGPGVPLPGQVIQRQRTQPGSTITGTTAIPQDNTIPQNTEGTQAYSLSIASSSAANVLDISSVIFAAQNTGGGQYIQAALFVDSVANAIAACAGYQPTDGAVLSIPVKAVVLAAAIAAVKVRFGNGNGATTYVDSFSAGSGAYGGVAGSFLEVQEVMA